MQVASWFCMSFDNFSFQILLKNGPYGYYVQLGEDRKGYLPKRASVSQVCKDFLPIHKVLLAVGAEFPGQLPFTP